MVLISSTASIIDDKTWLRVYPKIRPTEPIPIRRRITVTISFVADDIMKTIGSDPVLKEEITADRNSIVVLIDAISKIDIIIKLKSNPKIICIEF